MVNFYNKQHYYGGMQGLNKNVSETQIPMHELLVSLQVMQMKICRSLSQQSSGKRLKRQAQNCQWQSPQTKGLLISWKTCKAREKNWHQRNNIYTFLKKYFK